MRRPWTVVVLATGQVVVPLAWAVGCVPHLDEDEAVREQVTRHLVPVAEPRAGPEQASPLTNARASRMTRPRSSPVTGRSAGELVSGPGRP